jgi:nucleotide-binding universal stress UspA family protein
VPIDGSPFAEQVIPFARSIGGPGATLHLLRVIPPPEPIRGLWGDVAATEAEVAELTRRAADEEMAQTVQDWLETESKSIVATVLEGDPAETILAYAAERDIDLIALASHGRGAVGRLTFGSVADRIARASTLPVLIVCPTPEGADPAQPAVRRVVVPLDGSELASRALPAAREVALRLGLPILLVQVVNPAGAALTATAARSEAVMQIQEFQTVEAQTVLQEAASELERQGVPVETAIEGGPVVPGIEAVLQPGDLIALSSHGRGGVRRWLLGSVAERLIRSGVAPVLLVPAAERATSGR